jgi:hypothetical protein
MKYRTIAVLAAVSALLAFATPAKAQLPATIARLPTVTSASGGEFIMLNASNVDSKVTVTNMFKTRTLLSPVISTGLTATGSASNDFSGSTGTFKSSTGVNTFGGSSHTFAAVISPASNDGAALGSSSLSWSDLFLASGGVINFANGNLVLTHTSGILTMGTGELRITTVGTNAASVPTLGSTSTLTNKTLTSPVIATGLTASGSAANDFSASTGTFKTSTGASTFGGSSNDFTAAIRPTTSDGAALGSATRMWSDLFLASGAVINFDNGNASVTHSSGIITVGVGDLRVTTAGSNAASVALVGGTQTLTNKTLTAPVVGGGLTASGSADNDFSSSTGAFKTSSGATTITGSLAFGVQTLTGAGAVNLTTAVTQLVTTAADALTLSNGSINGQTKVIIMKTDGGDGTLTPTTVFGFTNIVFDAVADTVTLQWVTGSGWCVISSRGVTIN